MKSCRELSRVAAAAALALVGLIFAAMPAAHALGVSPTQVEMSTTGSASRAQIVVRNDNAVPIPVEAGLERLQLNENGSYRTIRDKGDSFLVFPPQAMIPARGVQVFRLQWVGEPMLAKSESYMLSVSQIPVKLPKRRSGVQIALSFGVVVNVAPPRGLPQLKVVGAAVATNAQGRRVPAITVFNPSNVHALLPQSTIALSSGGWSRNLSSADLTRSMGIGLVQPGQRRRFLLPVTLPGNVTTFKASLTFQPKRR